MYGVAGFGPRSDWYLNVRANPEVAVWLPRRRFTGVVTDVSDAPERLAVMRRVLLASGLAAPAAGIPVRALSDGDLATATAQYRVLRITPVPDRPAPPSVADLRWVWLPVAALTAAALGFRRRAGSRTAR